MTRPRVVMHGRAPWTISEPWAGRHVVMVADATSTLDALALARESCACGYTYPNVVNYRPGRIICTGVPDPAPCATCTAPRADRHHSPDYIMHRVPWDIPRHPFYSPEDDTA